MVVSTFNNLSYDTRRVQSHNLAIESPVLPAPFDKIHAIRTEDYNERFFHGYEIRGTSYNSFCFEHSHDQFTVVDSCKDEFADQYIATVAKITGNLEKVTRIIVQHSEWDHSSSIVHLYQLCPNATLYACPNAIESMKRFFPALQDARWEAWKNGHTEDLPCGLRLTFIHTPLLHWNDSSATKLDHIETGKGLLLSMDIFGAHIASEEVYIDEFIARFGEAKWEWEATDYYLNIVGSYILQTKNLLAKAHTLGALDVVCPAHGPFYRNAEDLGKVINLYSGFAQRKKTPGKVVIFYETNYNSTAQTCEVISNSLRAAGLKPLIMRVSAYDKSHWAHEAFDAEGFVFASATLNNTCLPYMAMVINYLGGLEFIKQRPVAIVSHFGWTQKACANKMRLYLESEKAIICPNELYIKWRATDDEFDVVRTWTGAFIEFMKANPAK